MTRVVGYLRVSTEEQAGSGLGLADQRAAITAEARRRDWEDLELVEDAGWSAKDLRRPGIGRALARLAAGDAQVLVVAKLDRLSRSLLDFADLMERARAERWALVALDLGVDTTTPAGELVANVMVAVAQWERRIIGQRTAAALAQKKAAGARLGAPAVLDPAVRARIVAAWLAGATLTAIAADLNAAGVPTARGGARWYASTIRAALRSAELDGDLATPYERPHR